jgi:hypothetical protein
MSRCDERLKARVESVGAMKKKLKEARRGVSWILFVSQKVLRYKTLKVLYFRHIGYGRKTRSKSCL